MALNIYKWPVATQDHLRFHSFLAYILLPTSVIFEGIDIKIQEPKGRLMHPNVYHLDHGARSLICNPIRVGLLHKKIW